MTSPARVLLIGDEMAHLQLRAVVLEHFWRIGIAVVDATGSVEFDADVFVVCHTLAEEDRQSWVERVRERSPAALVVKMNGRPAGPHGGADATVDDDEGPGALVSTIYELLTERGVPSRHWPLAGEAVLIH